MLIPPIFSESSVFEPINRIAFGSCANQNNPQPIWQDVLAAQPDAFIFLGDNVYADTLDLQEMRNAYEKLFLINEFQELKKSCRILATWDDHDYGYDNAGAENPIKDEARTIFLEFFPMPLETLGSIDGVYRARLLGTLEQTLQIILLDTRSFKTDSQLLGEEQWRWLEMQMQAPAHARILASSIQVIPDQHNEEKWADYPEERARLLELIRDENDIPILLISGDRHFGEVSRWKDITEITSSSLNASVTNKDLIPPNRYRISQTVLADNFGLIRIDWSKKRPRFDWRHVTVGSLYEPK